MKTAVINKIIKFSNVDGPGNRTAIFFQGCNLNCDYCHNPETINLCKKCKICVSACPVHALEEKNNTILWNEKLCIECDNCIKICPNNSSCKTKVYSVEEILIYLEKIVPFIKGITVSGGECSLNYEFITELFKEIKNRYKTLTCFVDTNGYIDFSDIKYKEFIEISDGFMLDIKSWDSREHKLLTGHSNENIIKNLMFLKSLNKLYEVRTVIVPKLLNNEETVKSVSNIIENTDIRYKLIKYRSLGVRPEKMQGISSPTNEDMSYLETIATKLNVKNIIII